LEVVNTYNQGGI